MHCTVDQPRRHTEPVISRRQLDILRAIALYKQGSGGTAPTLRELGRMVGISSTSVIVYHLVRLEGAGLLVRDPAAPRGISLPGERWSPPIAGRLARLLQGEEVAA